MVAAQQPQHVRLAGAAARDHFAARRQLGQHERHGAQRGRGVEHRVQVAARERFVAAEHVAQLRAQHHADEPRRAERANHFGHPLDRQAARDAGDRSAKRPGHAGAIQHAQQVDGRSVAALDEHVAQQADDEADHRGHPDFAGAEAIDARALEESHHQAADHADADDRADGSRRAPEVEHEIGIPIEQGVSYHQHQVGEVGTPERAAVDVRGGESYGCGASVGGGRFGGDFRGDAHRGKPAGKQKASQTRRWDLDCREAQPARRRDRSAAREVRGQNARHEPGHPVFRPGNMKHCVFTKSTHGSSPLHARHAGDLQRDRKPAAAGRGDFRRRAPGRRAGDRRQLARRHRTLVRRARRRRAAPPLPAPRGQAGPGHRHHSRHAHGPRARLRVRAQHGCRLQPSSALPAGDAGRHGPAGRRTARRDDRLALRTRRRHRGLAAAAAT